MYEASRKKFSYLLVHYFKYTRRLTQVVLKMEWNLLVTIDWFSEKSFNQISFLINLRLLSDVWMSYMFCKEKTTTHFTNMHNIYKVDILLQYFTHLFFKVRHTSFAFDVYNSK